MRGMINIAGASEGRTALIITELLKEKKGQCLIVVPSLNGARKLQTDLSFFSAPNTEILVLPPEDESIAVYEAKSNDYLLERMRVLRRVTSGED